MFLPFLAPEIRYSFFNLHNGVPVYVKFAKDAHEPKGIVHPVSEEVKALKELLQKQADYIAKYIEPVKPMLERMGGLPPEMQERLINRWLNEALIEMETGKPIVEVDLIKHAENGFLCPIESVDCYVKLVKTILGDKGLGEKFVKLSKKHIKENYTWENNIKAFKALY